MQRSLRIFVVLLVFLSQSCTSMTAEDRASKVTDLQAAQSKVEDLKRTNAALQEELTRVRGAIESIEQELYGQEKETENYKEKNDYLKSQLSSKKDELERIENSLALSVAQEKTYQKELSDARIKLNSASSSLSKKEKEYTELLSHTLKIAEEAQKENDRDERLLSASVVFNTPKSMYVGQSSEISLKVFIDKEIKDSIQDFLDDYEGIDLEGNTIHSNEAQLGKVVVASLRASSGIAVQSLSGAGDDADGRILDINNPDRNKWNWEIFAKSEGDQWIRVSLYYEKKNQDGINEARSYGTWRSKTIKVSVKSTDSVSAFFDKYILPNIEFLWGAILLPLGALIGARWKRRG